MLHMSNYGKNSYDSYGNSPKDQKEKRTYSLGMDQIGRDYRSSEHYRGRNDMGVSDEHGKGKIISRGGRLEKALRSESDERKIIRNIGIFGRQVSDGQVDLDKVHRFISRINGSQDTRLSDVILEPVARSSS